MVLAATGFVFPLIVLSLVAYGIYRHSSQKRGEYEREANQLLKDCKTGLRFYSAWTRIGWSWRFYSVVIHRNSIVLIGHKDQDVIWQSAMSYLIGETPEGFSIDHFNNLVTPIQIERGTKNISISGYMRSRTTLITKGFDAPEHRIKIQIRIPAQAIDLDAELTQLGIPRNVFDKVPYRPSWYGNPDLQDR